MKVGYELEFCSRKPITYQIRASLVDWFEIGTDRSLAPREPASYMYEIRSREPMNVVSVDVIALMLEELDLVDHYHQEEIDRIRRHSYWPPDEVGLPTKNGKSIFTTRNCGVHVHVSWDVKRAHIFFGHLVKVLTEKVTPFGERVDYCDPGFSSTRGGRYNALRWVEIEDGHFEVRLFNGTMKLRGIVNYLKMIRNEALLLARASQAA